MDLYRIISELAEEKNRLDRIIQSLEGVAQTEGGFAPPPVSRRGRKSMDGPARKEVSERMKRYWARRREQRAAESHAPHVQTAAAGSHLHEAVGA
jgi:hypothetical protein